MSFKETTKSIIQRFKDNAQSVGRLYFSFCGQYALPLLALFLIPTTISWFFLVVGNDAFQAGPDTAMITKIIFGAALDLVMGLAITLFIASRYAQEHFLSSYQKRDFYAKPLTTYKFLFIEELRSYLPILLKSLLLIVPGVIEALRLYFVSWVVIFDESYEKGEVDALERSREITLGHKKHIAFFLTIVLALYTLALLLLRNLLKESAESFFIYYFLDFLQLLAHIFITLYFTRYYFTYIRKKN